MDNKIFQVGQIRPPFHARSLLLRITENCTWNKCNFCTLYRGGQFKTRPVDLIKQEINNVAYYRDCILKHQTSGGGFNMEAIQKEFSLLNVEEQNCYSMVFSWIKEDNMKTVFLQDANTLVLKPDVLVDIISHLKKVLPSITLVSAYGRTETLAKISATDFLRLKDAGLNMIHSGYESGCDEVLKLLNKGTTQAEEIEAGQKVKAAGINFNIFYMPGSGGVELSHKNAMDTARVISAINPDFVRLRTFVVKQGTPMWSMQQAGEFNECSDIEKIIELKEMLENIKNCDGYIISDHIINLLPRVEGYMDKGIANITAPIYEFLTLPIDEQRIFQLARRLCMVETPADIKKINTSSLNQIKSYIKNIDFEKEWEPILRNYLRQYI